MPTVLIAALSACTPPADDVPYVVYDDTVRMVSAIDEALLDDRDVVWQSDFSDAHGLASPGAVYRDRRDRTCRKVTFSVKTGEGAFSQTAGYCQHADGAWVPDLPPGAGSRLAPQPRPSQSTENRGLRREMLIEFRRLQRRGESRADALRELRKRYSLQERRRAGF